MGGQLARRQRVAAEGGARTDRGHRSGLGWAHHEAHQATTRPVPAEGANSYLAVDLRRRAVGSRLGQVRNAFIRMVNEANDAEIARYDLFEEASTET